ncbi:sulfotransferase domain-containing protein [Thalassotalea eurytherma]|uniref:Sulfotransferase domain-containing protein n=1 Tax=Thalassotalea eurytherma TaxID=1144278 RepID=A0ABQ6H3L9_9GAMM|nr:sulfotransferase domain-containing protein [Thalassotalea eurytherma]GLX82104.1 hypothetical protein theurythT_15560 [Thalassotalea eurytherma]
MIQSKPPILVHCSYHKCLTKYFARVFKGIYNKSPFKSSGYVHFNSVLADFYDKRQHYQLTSVNNHAIDLTSLGDNYRVTRFIRDPRDMIISGYFYHKKAAEPWCEVVDPSEQDWQVVNGNIPSQMKAGESYAQLLNRLDFEQGLMAEIEFRKFHFESMRYWPVDNPNIKLIRYEEMLGNELATFQEVFEFYQLGWLATKIGEHFAKKYSASVAKKAKGHLATHMRDPESNQWKKHFSDEITEYFHTKYGDIIQSHGYEL